MLEGEEIKDTVGVGKGVIVMMDHDMAQFWKTLFSLEFATQGPCINSNLNEDNPRKWTVNIWWWLDWNPNGIE